MWQLFDIAYVIPASVFLGFWLGKFLDNKFSTHLEVACVMVFAFAGFILTIVKIKRFVDEQNKKTK